MNTNLIDIGIVAQGLESSGHWPLLKVTVDGHCIYNDSVGGAVTINHKGQASEDQEFCEIYIEYHGKQDQFNELNQDNKLLKTQSLKLEQIWINGVDIVRTGAIYQDLGYYRMNLDEDKRAYFQANGLPVGDTTNLHMFENGVWYLKIALPLLSTLAKRKSVIEPWEAADLEELIGEFARRVDICRTLEQKQKGII